MASARGSRVGAVWGAGLLGDNQTQTLGELAKGFDAAKGYLGDARDLYGGMASKGLGALGRYQDLAGVNGAGSQTAALTATPGYQFAFDQGMQALTRARAARGMLNTGGTDVDAMTFGQGLAGQTLGAERAALGPLMSLYQQGTAGEAGALGSLGDLATSYYSSRAGVIDDTNKNIMGLGLGALKAGDQAKMANQQMAMGLGSAGLKLLGQFAGAAGGGAGGAGGLGDLASLFSSGGGPKLFGGAHAMNPLGY